MVSMVVEWNVNIDIEGAASVPSADTVPDKD